MCRLRHRIQCQSLRTKRLIRGHRLNCIHSGAANAAALYSARHVESRDGIGASRGVSKFGVVVVTIQRDVPYWDKGKSWRGRDTWFAT